MRTYLLLLFVVGAGIFWTGRHLPTPPPGDLEFEIFLRHITDEMRAKDWAELGTASAYWNEIPDFQPGDLIPCPADYADWFLTVEAMYGDEVLYCHEQPFCRYDGANVDPREEEGMNRFRIVGCRLMDNAALSGEEFYAELDPDGVALDVDWNIVHGERRLSEFKSRLTMKPGLFGTVDLGQDRRLRWSFDTAD
jgi:hypothetical protein